MQGLFKTIYYLAMTLVLSGGLLGFSQYVHADDMTKREARKKIAQDFREGAERCDNISDSCVDSGKDIESCVAESDACFDALNAARANDLGAVANCITQKRNSMKDLRNKAGLCKGQSGQAKKDCLETFRRGFRRDKAAIKNTFHGCLADAVK